MGGTVSILSSGETRAGSTADSDGLRSGCEMYVEPARDGSVWRRGGHASKESVSGKVASPVEGNSLSQREIVNLAIVLAMVPTAAGTARGLVVPGLRLSEVLVLIAGA